GAGRGQGGGSVGGWRGRRSSPPAHGGAGVMGKDVLLILVIPKEWREGEEGNQNNEKNQNIDAHQSSPLPLVRARRYTEAKESPGAAPRALGLTLRKECLVS